MKRKKQRLELEAKPELNNAAIKRILGGLIPIFVKVKEGLEGDGKLRFFEKISLAFGALPDLPDLIDAATELPAEAWQGDYYDAAEIADISAYVKSLLPEDLSDRAEEVTLSIMEWVLTTVGTVDVIIGD